MRQDKTSRHPAKAQTPEANRFAISGLCSAAKMASSAAVTHNTQAIASVKTHRMREGLTSAEVAMDIKNQGEEKSASPSSAMRRCAMDQTLPKTRLPLVPPKPNEFFKATLMGISRAVLAQ